MPKKLECIEAEGEGVAVHPKTRKPYTQPETLHELALETRAGTPLVVDPLDPLGLEPKK
jgi:hypothetical protein